MTISFVMGMFTGTCFGISIMCLMAVNRSKRYQEDDFMWSMHIEDKQKRINERLRK